MGVVIELPNASVSEHTDARDDLRAIIGAAAGADVEATADALAYILHRLEDHNPGAYEFGYWRLVNIVNEAS